jgi:hypothetical protein
MPLLRYFAWLAPALLSTVATHAAPAPLFPNTSAVDEAALSSYSRSNRNCRPGEPRLEWTSMDLSRERWCRRKRARKPSPWHRRSALECVKVVPSTMLGALSRLRCPPPLRPPFLPVSSGPRLAELQRSGAPFVPFVTLTEAHSGSTWFRTMLNR